MATLLEHPHKLPRQHYLAIGKITFKWSLIEFHAHNIIRHYLKMGRKEGRVAFYRTIAREKITLLKTVKERWVDDPAIADEILEIAKKMEKLNKQRNNIVHGVWGREHSNVKDYYLVYVTEYKERIMPRAEITTPKDLEDFATELDYLYIRMKKLCHDAEIPEP